MGFCNYFNDAYIFSYVPSVVGETTLTFAINEDLIYTAPVTVYPGVISGNSKVSGAGMSMAEAGVLTHFQIQAIDSQGNLIDDLSDDEVRMVNVDVYNVIADNMQHRKVSSVHLDTIVEGGLIHIYMIFPHEGTFGVNVTVMEESIKFAEVEVFPPTPRSPQIFATNLPEERFEHSATSVDNIMYIFGGAKKDKTYISETWKLSMNGFVFSYRSEVNMKGDYDVSRTMPLLVNTSAYFEAGFMQATCADMLFMSSDGVVMKHWIDPLPGCGSEETIVWVQVTNANNFFLYYGSPKATDSQAEPTEMFDLYEDFEDEIFTSSGGKWNLDHTCTNLQFPEGSEQSFYTQDLVSLTGKRALKVDTEDFVGGSITWPVGSLLYDYKEGYVLKAYLYDSGCDGTHWISPMFDECKALDNGKTTSPVNNALGINTCSVRTKYAQAYPWASTHVKRSAGWHSMAFYHNGSELTLMVDNEEVMHQPTKSAVIDNIFIHGGHDAVNNNEAPSYWDSIFVTSFTSNIVLELEDEIQEVSYSSENMWTQISATGPPARQAHSAVEMNDSFYVYGGERSAYEYSDIWKFNTTTETWNFVSPLNDSAPPRHDHSAVVYDGEMYVYGGRGPIPMGDFWKFSFESRMWIPCPSSPGMAPRFGHTAVVIDSQMIVYGGYVSTPGGLSDELWSFDFDDYEWTLIGPRTSNFDEMGQTPYVADPSDAIVFPTDIPAARFSHVAVAVDKGMFIYGGAGGVTMKEPLDDSWFYDFHSKQWVPIYPETASVTEPRYDAAASILIDPKHGSPQMVIFGGHGTSGFLADTQVFFVGYSGLDASSDVVSENGKDL
mmetsp:Transcript_35126/g.48730  ORF Transcript_35126/g.48730 Transcript_35126/m.48730 type:complete len:831 (-) Transcript_35126:206-2698(-)